MKPKQFWLTIGVLLLLICSLVSSQCTSGKQFETLVGGPQNVHSVATLSFDVKLSSNDLVVGGRAIIQNLVKGFLYYVSESTCSIQWLHMEEEQADLGVTSVAFDPNTQTRIVAIVATNAGPFKLLAFENYANGSPTIMLEHFIINESVPQLMKLQFSTVTD